LDADWRPGHGNGQQRRCKLLKPMMNFSRSSKPKDNETVTLQILKYFVSNLLPEKENKTKSGEYMPKRKISK